MNEFDNAFCIASFNELSKFAANSTAQPVQNAGSETIRAKDPKQAAKDAAKKVADEAKKTVNRVGKNDGPFSGKNDEREGLLNNKTQSGVQGYYNHYNNLMNNLYGR
jgi:hypothetical protein